MATMKLTFAVIPTRDRPAELRQTISSLDLPPERILVIDNASTPPVAGVAAQVVRDEEQPPNISRLWNIGLDWAHEQAAGEKYAVAVLNDDLVLPPGFLDAMTGALDRYGAAIAYPDRSGDNPDWHNTEQGPVLKPHRMTGYAFVVDGQANLRRKCVRRLFYQHWRVRNVVPEKPSMTLPVFQRAERGEILCKSSRRKPASGCRRRRRLLRRE